MLKNFDCIDDKTGNMVGADMPAISVIYSIIFYHRLYALGAAVACIDSCFYGGMMIGPLTSAFVSTLILYSIFKSKIQNQLRL